MARFELSKREKTLIVGVGALALVAGVWLGLWMVPDAALDVPKETVTGYEGREVVDARYQPVPTWLPIFSFGVPLVAAFSIARIYGFGPEPDSEVPGGDGHGDD
ncbi:hypothetical protein [Haloarchaeobius sp. DYHT-AS-18]|uniref:hypothetical protein n=1 Tax=Haloarchaeobius sp. DYHT-AS-18 TaxID=3446117 RepID=UPI003EBED89B